MKRMLLLTLSILMLVTVLTACGTTAYVDDPYRNGYSNVSTTRDGTVNGTNGYYGSGYANGGMNGYANNGTTGYANGGTTGYANGYQNGAYGNGTTTTTTTGTTRSGMTNGTTSGTGMAGGR